MDSIHIPFVAGLALATLMAPAAAPCAVPAAGSTVAATPHVAVRPPIAVRRNALMPWNAVAVDGDGRFLVASPRWTANGDIRPAVAIAHEDGTLVPYPSAAWNSWAPGKDAANVLVSVNALHLDAQGGLWIVDSGAPEFGGAPVHQGPKVVHIDPRTDTVVRTYLIPDEVIRPHSYVESMTSASTAGTPT